MKRVLAANNHKFRWENVLQSHSGKKPDSILEAEYHWIGHKKRQHTCWKKKKNSSLISACISTSLHQP